MVLFGDTDEKTQDLSKDRVKADQASLTTNQGTKIEDNQNTLKAGTRGPSLLEDFIFREKITHFDHERIPERIVHARGAAAHGYFQLYESMAEYTKADFLQKPGVKTPVFVRFSTVLGSRGSADTVRDVRGFAVKFYTQEGNFDLVGNNIPIFFIQDAMKFPDLIHAGKPEPDNEMPQAATAHDTLWDFISVMPESMAMIMWAMSDRAIPRSFRMMEGFGIHTFRFVNAKGRARFVKFHWKPVLGLHSLVWDEAQQLAGKDADFHRRDLWEAIEDGQFPEWEFGVQIINEEDEHKLEFDLLDPTKLIPEEIVPVQRIGKLVLNRNPDNFFAETEQVAFHPGHVVPGIDFTNDPLLQGRLFSYTDTQLSRLGGPNFHEIPINRPICPFHNNQRDGIHRQQINVGNVAYQPNTLANGFPVETPGDEGGFVSYPEKMDGVKLRKRSQTFADHYSQATLFWNSQSLPEQEHIVQAFQFELGKLENEKIREQIVAMLVNVNKGLAARVAHGLGLTVPNVTPVASSQSTQISPALSMEDTVKDSIFTRKIAVLALEGFNHFYAAIVKNLLEKQGAKVVFIGTSLHDIILDSDKIKVKSMKTMPSVFFDAVLLCGNDRYYEQLSESHEALNYINEMFWHYKTIGIVAERSDVVGSLIDLSKESTPPGIVFGNLKGDIDEFAQTFISAIAEHRHWDRI